MDNKKRAIILDMDDTLEHGIFQSPYGAGNGIMMVLRPHLDELISKLQEAKKQGISIVLCTTANEPWVERFLTLKPEFRELFDRILTRDNEDEWLYFDKEQNPVEYEAQQVNYNILSSKPVTTFGYESILFIDDNGMEGERLKELFEFAQGKLEKDVTYFSGFGFDAGYIDLIDMLRYKKAVIQNPEIAQTIAQYLSIERNNPGCNMMCSVIDTFMNKASTHSLTLADEEYSEKYKKFRKEIRLLADELEGFACELEKQKGEELFGYTDGELQELKDYLSTDKKYPFEGIEVEQPQVDKRQQLEGLIQTAINTQGKLDKAEKLKEDFMQQDSKETEI